MGHAATRRQNRGKRRGAWGEWPVFLSLARGVGALLVSRVPTIPATSFRRLYAADRSTLPPATFLTLRDGFSLAYRVYPSAANRTLLLLHGAAGHSGHMHTLAKTIADNALARVYTIDLRGHGLSGGPSGHAVDGFEVLRDDVVEMLAAVRRAAAGSTVILGGFSAGGGLAVRLAESAAPGIDAFLLIAPYLGAAAPSTRPSIGGWAAPAVARMAALVLLNGIGVRRFNHCPVVTFRQPEQPRDGSEALRWSFNTAIAFGPRRWTRGLAAISANRPLLLIVGDRDDCFYPHAYGPMLAEYAPHGVVWTVDDCSHWDVLVAPAAMEAVSSWLSSLPGSTATG